MKRLALLTVPMSAVIAIAAIERILDTGDLWLGLTLLSLALLLLILPVPDPVPADDASTAYAPSADQSPSIGAFEAAPVGNQREG